MHLFAVWAPFAARVDLVLPRTPGPVPLEAGDGGWWRVEVPGAGHGTDYWFSVDTGKPLPDPRSAWQPHGVHGPSRVFDPGTYRWTDQTWAGRDLRGGVCYELHVGTFTATGTLDAAVEHLDYLVDLGVDTIALMPVAAFDGERGWGYDGVDLFAVHAPYGGPAALQRFVDACHARDLAVTLDVVYNHLGPSGNYLEAFGPYFSPRHHTPWGPAVNLDDDHAREVRRWIIDNAVRWLTDFHLDGLRLDAVHALLDDSDRHVLTDLADEVERLSGRLGRPLGLIAESDLNDPTVIEPTAAGGLGMTAQWSDDFHHAIHALTTGRTQGYYVDFGSVDVLADTLTRVFHHDGGYSTFRGSRWGRPVQPSRHRGHQFLGYLQNHDQVGNRADGDRLAATVSPGRLAAAAAVLFTSPFTPLLFMGEEWAASTAWQFFTDFPAELGAQVTAGRQAEFARHGWPDLPIPDPQDPETHRNSVLNWAERDQDAHARMLAWYRSLIALRRAEPDLRDDDLAAVRVTRGPGSDRIGTGWLIVHRGRFDVLVNLTDTWQVLPCPDDVTPVLVHGPISSGPGGLGLGSETVAIVRRDHPTRSGRH